MKPPKHLRTATKLWWKSVVRDYTLFPHHLHLLQLACECLDRSQEAREAIARDGMVVIGREGGIRPHPAIAIERDARIAFARFIRELDLDVEPPSANRTAPPALRSNRR